MEIWVTFLLALPCLAGKGATGGSVSPTASPLPVLAHARLEDNAFAYGMWKYTLCAEEKTVPKTQCTVMRGGKVYVVNKDDIPRLKEYGMALVSKHYPAIFFVSKPLVFCCDFELTVAGLTNSTSLQRGKEERVQRGLTDWKKRYEALKAQNPHYEHFMRYQNARVDKSSKVAVAMIKKARAMPEKEGNNDLEEFIKKIDEIRFNELETRLNKAETIRAKRADNW